MAPSLVSFALYLDYNAVIHLIDKYFNNKIDIHFLMCIIFIIFKDSILCFKHFIMFI